MKRCFTASVMALLLSSMAGCGGGGSSPSQPPPTTNTAPTITSVTPASVTAGAAALTLDVKGSGFVAASTLQWNGTPLTTTYVSATELTATLPASDLAGGTTAKLTVVNGSSSGGTSTATAFLVNSPTPHVDSISPSTIAQGFPAMITLSGSGFEANSLVTWNGSSLPTTFVSANSLQAPLTAADTQVPGAGQLAVTNPGPGGSTTSPITLSIVAAGAPVISSMTPAGSLVNATGTTLLPATIQGTNFAANATLSVNGQALAISSQTATSITTGIPAPYLAQAEQLDVVVTNPGAVPLQSALYVFNVVAVPVISGLTPASAPIGSPEQTLQVTGSGFLPDSVVNWNGVPLKTQYAEKPPTSPTLTATVPAVYLSMPGVANVTVSSPENSGAVSQLQAFPTYLPLPTNTIAYNQKDGLLYASVPGYVGAGLGNSIVAINPTTGVIEKTFPVGSEPDKFSISDDGTTLFVGLDGAAAVKQIDLTGTNPGFQFSLGQYKFDGADSGLLTPVSVAALPGQPNSVAVLESNANLSVFDAGVARPNSASLNGYANQNSGSLSFGSSAATLYALVSNDGFGDFAAVTLDDSGVTGTSPLIEPYFTFSSIQYDAGNLYLNNGAVVSTGRGSGGQFYTTGTNLAVGPIVSDSTLGRAWILPQNGLTPGYSNEILAFNESNFAQVGAIVVAGNLANGLSFGAIDLVRWGQNGLAFNNGTQIYMLQSPVVKDLSQSPADLSVAIQAPGAATTGGALTYTITVTNAGPGTAQGVNLSTTLADSFSYQSTTNSSGTCSGSVQVICNLGSLASGATATVKVTGTALDAGSVESTALVSSSSYDPAQSNNIATATTSVTGAAYSAVPALSSVSPNLVLAGSSATTVTVTGTGFSALSTISWNGAALPTTYLSATQLTAIVPEASLTSLGWGKVAVSNPSPGGGQSQFAIVSICQAVNVPAAGLVYDPFSRKLYASVPAAATNITPSSLVAIDPLTGTVGAPVLVGNDPSVLAETSDGNALYLGLNANNTLSQFNLLTQTVTATYPLTEPGQGSQPAYLLAAQPGSDTTLAIGFQDGIAGIFDISGNTGAFRPNLDGGGSSMSFADATHLYAGTSNTGNISINRFTVDSNGLTHVDSTSLNGLGVGFALGQDGLIYGVSGGIINPATTPPSQIALLPITPGSPSYPTFPVSGNATVPDSAQHKSFLVAVNNAGSVASYLERFDTTNYVNEETYQLPLSSGAGDAAYQLLRWGQDGLVVRASGPVFGTASGVQMLLIKGPFVLPAEVQTNPAPTLSGILPGTIAHNSGNQYLTAVGTGFVPGAVILWNGVAHTTNYIDANHLQFAAAASEITTTQTVSLTAENPGSGPSSALSLAIQ